MKRYFGGKPTELEMGRQKGLLGERTTSSGGYGSAPSGKGMTTEKDDAALLTGRRSRDESDFDGDIGAGRGEFFGGAAGIFDDDEYKYPSDVELDNDD